jgi:hypothetical protein
MAQLIVNPVENAVSISTPISFGTQYRATRAVVAHSRVAPFSYGFFVGVPALALVGMTGYDLARPSVLDLSCPVK